MEINSLPTGLCFRKENLHIAVETFHFDRFYPWGLFWKYSFSFSFISIQVFQEHEDFKDPPHDIHHVVESPTEIGLKTNEGSPQRMEDCEQEVNSSLNSTCPHMLKKIRNYMFSSRL